jgi:hypothetical protein
MEGSGLPEAKARIEELDKEIAAAYERWEFLEVISEGQE